MEEIFKDIIGYEGLYKVSNTGRVYSLGRKFVRSDGINSQSMPRMLKPGLGGKRKYYIVSLTDSSGNKRSHYVHDLVYLHFVCQEKPKGTQIDHIDRNSLNNLYTNLRVVTQAENLRNTNRWDELKENGGPAIKPSANFIGPPSPEVIVRFVGQKLDHPEHGIVEVTSDFWSRFKIKKGDLYRVLRGERKSCQGWKLYVE